VKTVFHFDTLRQSQSGEMGRWRDGECKICPLIPSLPFPQLP
jgi:hypothetical protein